MPKGYWIPHLDVSNMQGFQAYRDMADAAHKRFGSKLLARGGRREVVEGKLPARNVLREFNSFDEAKAFYHGPEYSAAHPLREPHSVCDFVIAEGYDGLNAVQSKIRLSQDSLASMVSLSRQTTNQLLKSLESQQIISLKFGEIQILDIDRLRAASVGASRP